MPQPFKIEDLTVFLSVSKDEEEGVCAFQTADGTMLPMVAADHTRAEQLRPLALAIARQAGCRIIVARFDRRTDLEEIS